MKSESGFSFAMASQPFEVQNFRSILNFELILLDINVFVVVVGLNYADLHMSHKTTW